MRKRMGEVVRKAGTALNDFDKAYARKFDRAPNGFVDLAGLYGRGIPLSESKRSVAMSEYEARGGEGPRTREEARTGSAADAAVFTANLASRYLLPTGGITLAGKGLYDLTVAYGSSADQPQPAELRLQGSDYGNEIRNNI